jgi:hypothetical protein
LPIPFNCPKCGQKLTLTSSKPGDWLDCPNCEAAIQVPGAAQPKPTPRAAKPQAAPPTEDDLDFLASVPEKRSVRSKASQSLWSDKRVQLGAIAGGMGLIVVALLVIALTQKGKPPEQVHNDPPAATTPTPPAPAPVTPPVKPKEATPTPPVPKEDLPKPAPPKEDVPRLEEAPPPRLATVKPPPDYSKLDQFGNPIDQNTGLAQHEEFKGQRLLFWSPHTSAGKLFFGVKNPLWKALEDKGFVVRREFGKFDAKWLKETDQLWILSTARESVLKEQRKVVPDLAEVRKELKNTDPEIRDALFKAIGAKAEGYPKDWTGEDLLEMTLGDLEMGISPTFRLTDKDYDAIVAFAKDGKGLCLLADNDPFTYEANELAKRLFDVSIEGNYPGQKIAYVKNGQLTPQLIKKYKGDYEVDPHSLLTGVNFVYEGITISKPSASDKLDVALKASDGNPVLAVSKVPGLRVIIDCGFTRYCYGPSDRVSFICMTAGTTRLAQNMAAYLAGKTEAKKP